MGLFIVPILLSDEPASEGLAIATDHQNHSDPAFSDGEPPSDIPVEIVAAQTPSRSDNPCHLHIAIIH